MSVTAFAGEENIYPETEETLQVVEDVALLNDIARDLQLDKQENQSFVVRYDSTRAIYRVTIEKKINTEWYEPSLYSTIVADANDTTGGWEWVSILSQSSKRGAHLNVGQWEQTSHNYSIANGRKTLNCTLKGTWTQVVGPNTTPIQKYLATYSYSVGTSEI